MRALLALLLLGQAACTGLAPVAPWQKGQLAKPEMGIGGVADGAAYAEHVYASREGTAGGSRVGGGGCGCN